MSITENIEKIEERIQKACIRAGRKREEVTLMGVSKFVPLEKIEEAYRAGIRCFGESRVKEGIEKFSDFKNLHKDISIHLIGSLQTNKAKDAAGFYDCIQSADRLKLIYELVKHVRGKPLNLLLELHTGEETKSGFAGMDELFKAAEIVFNEPNLKPSGLMTMAPFTTDSALIRSSFKQLVKTKEELEKRFPSGENGSWDCLSMGMSNDFEIAIEEGSTLLRIGSSIFKE